MKQIKDLSSECPALDKLGKTISRYASNNYAAEAWDDLLLLPEGDYEVFEANTAEWTTTVDAQGNHLPTPEAAGFAFAAFKNGNRIYRGELTTMMRGCESCPKVQGEFYNWWNANKGETFHFVSAQEIARSNNNGTRKKITWTF